LQAILKLERHYAHADIEAALHTAVTHRYFDPMVVEYLLRAGSLQAEPPAPVPLLHEVAVEQRALSSYDQFFETGGLTS
jgi:hypothetical protein